MGTRDKAKYTGILQQLLTQGLCQLLEPALLIRCRQADQALVEQVIPAALAEYKATVGKDRQIKWTQRIGWEPTKLEVSRFLHRRARLRWTTHWRRGWLWSASRFFQACAASSLEPTLAGSSSTRSKLDALGILQF